MHRGIDRSIAIQYATNALYDNVLSGLHFPDWQPLQFPKRHAPSNFGTERGSSRSLCGPSGCFTIFLFHPLTWMIIQTITAGARCHHLTLVQISYPWNNILGSDVHPTAHILITRTRHLKFLNWLINCQATAGIVHAPQCIRLRLLQTITTASDKSSGRTFSPEIRLQHPPRWWNLPKQ